jgi:hypothetical protein
MVRLCTLAALLIWLIASPSSSGAAQPAQLRPRCLHGSAEQPSQRARREQALRMARQINQAEDAGSAQPPSQPRNYRPFNQLPNMPPAPDGFRLQFYTDGPTYTFSLKDTVDACQYAIFSDQDRGIYEATPQTGVRIVPVDTRD